MVEAIYNHFPQFWVKQLLFDPSYLVKEIILYPALLAATCIVFALSPIGTVLAKTTSAAAEGTPLNIAYNVTYSEIL